jgi:uncharacterized protein YjiS (DUF1127 family)
MWRIWLSHLVRRARAWLCAARIWRRRSRTRRALQELDARELVDIGRTEAERKSECAKWFWQSESEGAW